MHLDPTDLAPISTLSINHPQIPSSIADQIPMGIVDSIIGPNFQPSSPLITLGSFAPRPECSQVDISVLIVDDNDINLKVRMRSSIILCIMIRAILLLESSKLTVRKIMSTFIRKIGFHYETASNGLIALEKYRNSNQRYSFVLMGKPGFSGKPLCWVWLTKMPDISMPVMDGLVATRKIREYERSNALNPACIMAVTAVASNETREASLKAGVDDFLVKPLSLTRLRELMLV